MTPRKNHITLERLHAIIHYDPTTGIFIRKPIHGRGRCAAGIRADYLRVDGYSYVCVDRMSYLAHRLAWIYMTGVVPAYLDHINGMKSDNRIENLRIATQWQNQLNHSRSLRNTNGIKGVCWSTRNKRWIAQSRMNSKSNWLGSFMTKDEAEAAVKAFRELHHGEFINHG